jgi:hypothetical protein
MMRAVIPTLESYVQGSGVFDELKPAMELAQSFDAAEGSTSTYEVCLLNTNSKILSILFFKLNVIVL